jgi:hypothetical protein
VSRPGLEVADVFHRHGAAWRKANAGHLSLGQLQVMSAIEHCRSAALGGHVERCQDCGHSRIAYNSCRNRHFPKCQGAAARDWLAAREADLLPAGYFYLVFTLPAEIAPIAHQNKAAVYDLLFPRDGRDAAHHRRRSQAPRCPHRLHRRALQTGVLRRTRRLAQPDHLCLASRAATDEELVRLRQAALCGGPRRCSPISPATSTASPSRTATCSASSAA